jgi:hypothetical protein
MYKKLSLLIVAIFISLLSFTTSAFAAKECPTALLKAANDYRLTLQTKDDQIRDSSLSDETGIVPTQVFDLVEHKCHAIPGQAYRVFGSGACKAASEEDVYKVTYPYKLFYRKGETRELLFKEGWKEGTDGLWQVSFEETINGWEPMGQKEILDLGPPKKHNKNSKHNNKTKNNTD